MRRFLTLLALASAPTLFAQTPCESGFADIYPCENIDLMSFIPLEDVGSPTGTNDIWGWVDPDSGREFAILCLRSGTAFVEVTDPVNPVYLGTLPSFIEGNNTWRDAKVFNNYVFVVSEFTGHGMQIMDLTKLVDPLLIIPTPPLVDARARGDVRRHAERQMLLQRRVPRRLLGDGVGIRVGRDALVRQAPKDDDDAKHGAVRANSLEHRPAVGAAQPRSPPLSARTSASRVAASP